MAGEIEDGDKSVEELRTLLVDMEKEAEIVAKAGQAKTITIATNMAGRGVDIKLGGELAELSELRLGADARRQGPDHPWCAGWHAALPLRPLRERLFQFYLNSARQDGFHRCIYRSASSPGMNLHTSTCLPNVW